MAVMNVMRCYALLQGVVARHCCKAEPCLLRSGDDGDSGDDGYYGYNGELPKFPILPIFPIFPTAEGWSHTVAQPPWLNHRAPPWLKKNKKNPPNGCWASSR